ncbi:TIR domain-containing protein [Acinetobacter zhairhuonensis]|uniref:TIR domain-containing protein n=1 Tax=Acinetobacter sp. A7.4 TaxID=2919921 RepID=UPI001F4FF1E5|nr:TIR domain-containing protein [Acinetobacter sp. A7.4]MCJ8161997.1 TIR domain-containing protein [Acinetobacter sp. A7.4]
MTQRHKVFVSYHHANDQEYRDKFESLFADRHDIIVSKSVQIGDIDINLKTETIRQKIRDEYLSDSTVTVILIGSETWKRKHVDWEISSSIRSTKNNSRSGLLGIILPSYPRGSTSKYNQYTIPPRLYDNLNCGFASIYNWNNDPKKVQKWIHEAFLRRNTILPSNSRDLYINNCSDNRLSWEN